MRSAIRGNASATRNYFLAIQGMVPRESFFNERNMQALLGADVRKSA